MSPDTKLTPGDVVQIDPEHPLFGGCFALVTEVKPWGIQGFVSIPQERGKPPGEAYCRLEWRQIELVGRASWVPQSVYEG